MIRSTLLSMALATVALAGCASSSGTRNQVPSTATTDAAQRPGMGPQSMPAGRQGMGAQGMGMMGGDMCPMQVQGSTVAATDVDGGVALDFKTTGDVAELRQRVRRMAQMHQHGASRGMMMGGMMPAAIASVEDIEGGARLVLRPEDPSQLAALREHARMHAARMASGQCPMMSGSQMGKTPAPTDGAHHEAHHPPK